MHRKWLFLFRPFCAADHLLAICFLLVAFLEALGRRRPRLLPRRGAIEGIRELIEGVLSGSKDGGEEAAW